MMDTVIKSSFNMSTCRLTKFSLLILYIMIIWHQNPYISLLSFSSAAKKGFDGIYKLRKMQMGEQRKASKMKSILLETPFTSTLKSNLTKENLASPFVMIQTGTLI